MCASVVQIYEGHFPHNTIIPNHDKLQTSQKVTIVAPLYNPWWYPVDLPGLCIDDSFAVHILKSRAPQHECLQPVRLEQKVNRLMPMVVGLMLEGVETSASELLGEGEPVLIWVAD